MYSNVTDNILRQVELLKLRAVHCGGVLDSEIIIETELEHSRTQFFVLSAPFLFT